jgi:hypothetical protein
MPNRTKILTAAAVILLGTTAFAAAQNDNDRRNMDPQGRNLQMHHASNGTPRAAVTRNGTRYGHNGTGRTSGQATRPENGAPNNRMARAPGYYTDRMASDRMAGDHVIGAPNAYAQRPGGHYRREWSSIDVAPAYGPGLSYVSGGAFYDFAGNPGYYYDDHYWRGPGDGPGFFDFVPGPGPGGYDDDRAYRRAIRNVAPD